MKLLNVHESLYDLGRQSNYLRQNIRSGKVASQVVLLRDMANQNQKCQPIYRYANGITTCASCQMWLSREIMIYIWNEFCQIEVQLIQVALPTQVDSGQKGELKFKAHSFLKEVKFGHVKHLSLPFMWTPAFFPSSHLEAFVGHLYFKVPKKSHVVQMLELL